MASENTNADALRLYLTGAASVGAEQPFHSLSLGGFRSGTELGLAHDLVNPMPGIVVEFVSGENGPGSGAIAAIDVDSLAWTPPGGAQGAVVAIANGETKVIEGNTPSKYLRVSRTSATDLGGAITVNTKRCLGSAVVGRNVTVDGATTYSGLIFENGGASGVTNLKVWIVTDANARTAVAQETVIGDAIQDISVEGDTSAPDGVSGWNSGTSPGAGLNIGTVAAGASVGLWIRRTVAAAVDATPEYVVAIGYSFTWDGDDYTDQVMGHYRVSDDSLEGYLLYRGVDAEPDLTAAAWETFASLGHVTAALAADATYYFVLRKRNKYGLVSQNTTSTIIDIDAGGDEVLTPPSAPLEPLLSPLAAGQVNASAIYDGAPDGDDKADTWLIYLTSDGSTPDPDVDTPVEVAMVFPGDQATLDYDTVAFANGATIKAIIRTRRTGEADSTNLNVVETTASTENSGDIEPGSCWVIDRAGETITRVWTHDADNYIDLVQETGVFRFVIDGNAVAGITAGGLLARAGTTDSTAYTFDKIQADLIEIDAGSGALGFAGGDPGSRYRIMEISPAGDLRVSAIVSEPTYPFAGVRADYVSWVDPNLDFSPDLLNVIMRIEKVAVLGIVNGELHVKGITTI